MRTRIQAILVGLLSISVVMAAAPNTMQRGWTMLGQRSVSDRADHDVITINGDRTYRQIKLTVQRASVDFRRVVVHFANGDDQTVEMKNTVRAGGETRAIDLEGNTRAVRSVEFWYDANTRRGRQAVVRLFGKD